MFYIAFFTSSEVIKNTLITVLIVRKMSATTSFNETAVITVVTINKNV